MATFGQKLRAIREKKGLSQKEFGEAVGRSQNLVSQWESGAREPAWSTLQQIAAVLGVKCTALTSDPEPPDQ